MFRPSLTWLLGLLLVSASCTAGNYDAGCDPTVKTLLQDVCNRLNPTPPDPKACSLYQCDRESASCKLAPRDYDRDGDPEPRCGGTDCNDNDPTVNGLNSTCSCQNTPTNMTCTIGIGVCQRSGPYSCVNQVLTCGQPGSPSTDYMPAPDSLNHSWDWNCDGINELGCTNKLTGVTSECPAANCDATLQGLVGTQNDAACDAFCGQIADKKDPRCDKNFANFVVCTADCAKPVLTCHCTPNPTGLTQAACVRYTELGTTNPNYVSMLSSILCR